MQKLTIEFEDSMKFSPIPGYEDYLINRNGDVFSLKKNQIIKPWILRVGYKQVQLRKEGVRKGFTIHRLLMLTFVGESNLQVNHKDGNKLNNSLSNLEYVTCAENIQHSYNIGIRVGPKPWLGCKSSMHPQAKKIISIDKEGNEILFGSIVEAAKYHGYTATGINNNLNRGVKSRYGLTFKYAEA